MTEAVMPRKEAVRYLRERGYSATSATLRNLAMNNNARKGPPFYVVRGRASYKREELDAWLAANMKRVE